MVSIVCMTVSGKDSVWWWCDRYRVVTPRIVVEHWNVCNAQPTSIVEQLVLYKAELWNDVAGNHHLPTAT